MSISQEFFKVDCSSQVRTILIGHENPGLGEVEKICADNFNNLITFDHSTLCADIAGGEEKGAVEIKTRAWQAGRFANIMPAEND